MKKNIGILIIFASLTGSSMVFAEKITSSESKEIAQEMTHIVHGVVVEFQTISDERVVVLKHDAVKELNWPAMTMPFVINTQIEEKLSTGKEISAEFVPRDGKLPVLKKIK